MCWLSNSTALRLARAWLLAPPPPVLQFRVQWVLRSVPSPTAPQAALARTRSLFPLARCRVDWPWALAAFSQARRLIPECSMPRSMPPTPQVASASVPRITFSIFLAPPSRSLLRPWLTGLSAFHTIRLSAPAAAPAHIHLLWPAAACPPASASAALAFSTAPF